MRRILPLLPAILLSALPAGGAMAQMSRDTPGMIPQRGQAAPQQPAAPALPGVVGRRTPAPIAAEPSAAGLSPNAALFDAINRGDLAAVRDAVGRGANLEARNGLGLTPIDAAVDQGRTDISFYLLSARDMSRSPPLPADSADLATPPASPAARTPARVPAAQAALSAAASAAAAPVTPRTARLWANDGGAPRPELGFLGFDAGRPAGANPPAESAARRPGRG
jgi:hypothetical protein